MHLQKPKETNQQKQNSIRTQSFQARKMILIKLLKANIRGDLYTGGILITVVRIIHTGDGCRDAITTDGWKTEFRP